MIIKWKKGIFKRTYELFADEQKIGSLAAKVWTSGANGTLNKMECVFQKKGFFKPGIEIISGIELSSEINGIDVHVLGYLFDLHDQAPNRRSFSW